MTTAKSRPATPVETAMPRRTIHDKNEGEPKGSMENKTDEAVITTQPGFPNKQHEQLT